jgi:hypothetical protein
MVVDRYIKLPLTVLTIVACVTLPFLTTVLRNIYSIDINDNSFESMNRYKTQLIPIRDMILFSIVLLCLTLSIWTFMNYGMRKQISNFDLLSSIMFVLVGAIIIFARTMVPSGLIGYHELFEGINDYL